MEKIFKRFGRKFSQRILTPNELLNMEQTAQPARFLAKRFAAKEASAKAFGTGFRDGLSLPHIGVSNNKNGKPLLEFFGQAEQFMINYKISNTQLSLSDDGDYAIAFVIFYSSP
ncbi:MAG: holo-ACP synthase [Gammaproteobacteria bacterium]|nr:holo-ACP synthase [Gammaproteobacteria bacterium]